MNDEVTRVTNEIDSAYRNKFGTDLLLPLASDPVGEGEREGGTCREDASYYPVDIGAPRNLFKLRADLFYRAGLPLGCFGQRPPRYLVSAHL